MAIGQQTQWFGAQGEFNGEASMPDRGRRLQHQVEIQSHQIDQVLSQRQIPAGVSGGSVRTHWVTFDLAGQLNDGWNWLRSVTGSLTGEIAAALGVPEVHLERQDGALRLVVKRTDSHPVDLLDLLDLVPEANDLNLALGLDHQGQPVMLNLNQPDLHNILVAGESGAGKSSLLRSLAVSLALTCRQSRAQLVVIGLGSAPSGITSRPNPIYPLSYLPHVLFPVATEVDEASEALAYLVEEVDYRADNGISSPALIIIIDDADMLLKRAGGAVADQMAALLNAPAGAGVRVVIGARNPGLPTLWQMLHHNVDLRLAGRMADEHAAKAATGLEDSYAHFLEGKGDFIAVSAAGVERFQAAYIDDYDLHLTLTELHRESSPILLAQSLADRDMPADAAFESRGFTYDAGNGRASFEADDRASRSTVEITTEPTKPLADSQENERDLSWLDGAEIDGRDQGLARTPVRGFEGDDDDPLATAMTRYQEQWHELAAAAGEDDGEDGAGDWLADEPAPAGDEAALDPGGDGVGTGQESEGGNGFGHYEMLPFDVETAADEGAGGGAYDARHPEPEVDRKRPAPADGPADRPRRGPGRKAETGQRSRLGSIIASRKRAQKMWPVEPTYTEIDDDLWGESDDEDGWRGRLH